ncbi:hypothetical protein A2U01_0033201, partial [Trifolium medium]|nr:hypothetical protein [Trifolium medium]
MSTPTKSSPIKSNVPKSPPQEVLFSKITEATPITIVLPEDSKCKSKSSKRKPASKSVHTMHELYVEKIVKSDAVDNNDERIHKNVSSDPAISQKIDDLGLENQKCAEKLGKDDLGCSNKQEDDNSVHNKVIDNFVVEPSIDKENAMQDATT